MMNWVGLGLITLLVVSAILIRRRTINTQRLINIFERELQQKENEHDERRLPRMEVGSSESAPPDGLIGGGARNGTEGARQEIGGPGDAVCVGDRQAGTTPQRMTEAEFAESTEAIKVLIVYKLKRLEQDRRRSDIVAHYAAIGNFDPTLARLLDEVDYAAIKPMKRVLDHLRRKEMLYLVKPTDERNK